MLKDDTVECRECDRLSGEAERLESECSDGRLCAWKAFQADKVGEPGVMEARKVWIPRFGAESDVLGGLDGR